MNKLLDRSFNKLIRYAALVLAVSIPVYYFAISRLWQYELDEHNIQLTPEAGREDTFLIIGAVTFLTVLFFIVLLVVLILVNRGISHKLWQPFYSSIQKIKQFNLSEHKTVDFVPTEIAEFAELNESLRTLIAGNIAAYEQQKEFADNASHELQTPLAIMQSKLELLLQSQDLDSGQYIIIEDTLKALSRVSRINKNLLLLTKIENGQFMDQQHIGLSEMLHDSIAQFSSFAETKNVCFKVLADSSVSINGNRVLVEILLNNLLMNAIRHSPEGTTVTVSINGKRLVASNPGTAALQGDHLFQRFSSASSQTPGTGLGLALVKQICTRYNWTAGYSFDNNEHHFAIYF